MSFTVAGATALAAGLAAAGQAAAIGGQAAANTRVAKLQNQFNIDMWNRTNEYNSPQAQMQRLSDAGLNPNLIYGNLDSGRAAPAQQVAPQAPDFSPLAKAFNIQNLLTAAANTKKAQEEARLAELTRFDKEDERDAMARFQDLYMYNPETGRFETYPNNVTVTATNPRGHRVGDRFIGGALFTRLLGSTDPRMHLLSLQRNYMNPQIEMARYDARFYPYSYWIDRGTKITSGLGDLGGLIFKMPFKFNKGSFTAPTSKTVYHY